MPPASRAVLTYSAVRVVRTCRAATSAAGTGECRRPNNLEESRLSRRRRGESNHHRTTMQGSSSRSYYGGNVAPANISARPETSLKPVSAAVHLVTMLLRHAHASLSERIPMYQCTHPYTHREEAAAAHIPTAPTTATARNAASQFEPPPQHRPRHLPAIGECSLSRSRPLGDKFGYCTYSMKSKEQGIGYHGAQIQKRITRDLIFRALSRINPLSRLALVILKPSTHPYIRGAGSRLCCSSGSGFD
eukprot:GHVU01137886.1.p1 GENE.GHVU01137886.1~~GHVU01137886.1.p1  ORF type:complete len:247 (-),score=8.60 GHVU01137886.1:74-814(-)